MPANGATRYSTCLRYHGTRSRVLGTITATDKYHPNLSRSFCIFDRLGLRATSASMRASQPSYHRTNVGGRGSSGSSACGFNERIPGGGRAGIHWPLDPSLHATSNPVPVNSPAVNAVQDWHP